MSQVLRDLVVRLGLQSGGISGAQQAQSQLSGLDYLARRVQNTLAGIAIAWGTRAVFRSFGEVTEETANWSRQLGQIATLSPQLSSDITGLSREMIALAEKTGTSLKDIGEGAYWVHSGFGATSKDMEQLEIVTKLARTGLTDVATAMKGVMALTRTYGDESLPSVRHAADLLAKTVGEGALRLGELVPAVEHMSPLAHQLGVSREEVMAWLTALAHVTGSVSQAGTQGQQVLAGFLKPTKELHKVMVAMGVDSAKTMIQHHGLVGTLKMLHDRVQKDEDFAKLTKRVQGLSAALEITGPTMEVYNSKLNTMFDMYGGLEERYQQQITGSGQLAHAFDVLKTHEQALAGSEGAMYLATKMIDAKTAAVDLGHSLVENLGLLAQLSAAKKPLAHGGEAEGPWETVGQGASAIAGGVGLAVRGVWDVWKTAGGIAAFLGRRFTSPSELESDFDALKYSVKTDWANFKRLGQAEAHMVARTFGGREYEREKFGATMEEMATWRRQGEQAEAMTIPALQARHERFNESMHVVGIQGDVHVYGNMYDRSRISSDLEELVVAKVRGALRNTR